MYDSNISDVELVQFHNKVKVNLTFELAEMINNSLFIIEEITDSILKIIPLFNCDVIISSNEDDKILDNKCIICLNQEGTVFNFISNNELNDLNIVSEIVEKFDEEILYGIVFDNVNQSPVKDVNLNIDLIDNENNLKENINLISDKYGGFVTTLKDYSDNNTVRITIQIEDIIKTFEVQ